MDTSTIDQAYQQLQTEFQELANSIQALAQKLQTAAQSGDTNLNSGFGRAIELGAGVGLGEDLINSIF